ncbi:MAG TPA: hypothetical protein VFZ80_06310 [Acidimicrobiia bacterium]
MLHSDSSQLVKIYLDDHWAGAGAGLNLARRMMRNNQGTAWIDDLSWVAAQIEADHRVLADIRKRLGVEGGGVKRRLAVLGERVARLKPNGRIIGYSPLSRVLEAEALISGVVAKRNLWAGLHQGLVGVEFPGVDFESLQERADEQLELLRSIHREAVSLAFGADAHRRVVSS